MTAIATPVGAPAEAEFDPFAGVGIQRVVPTTEAQREIWHACKLGDEASLAYNESISLRLTGSVDAALMQAALIDLCERHEALRCTLGPEGTTLVVGSEARLTMGRIDLRGLAATPASTMLERERRAAVELPFDLVEGPLVRASLVSTSDDSHELVFTAHHIVCDGWSLAVLASDLLTLYRARRSSQPANLRAAQAFGDHVLALASPEAQLERERDERYWVSVHDGAGQSVALPTDRPRLPLARNFASRREDLEVDAALTQALRAMAARHGVSLFSALFGAYGALLARLSGSNDVTVGVPAAGQAAAGQLELVGHCVNLLPVRMAIDLESGADALFAAARGATLDAYEHQQCTFGGLLQKLKLARDPSRLPLVSVLFNLDAAIDERALSDEALRVSLRGNPRSFENFELFLNVSQIDNVLVLECQYQTGLFDAVTIQRWLGLYVAALRRLASDPAATLVAALAPSADEVELLSGFNATALEHDRSARIDTLIAAQAAATPDAIAVLVNGRRTTYGELLRRADAVAAALQERGVGPGDLVGVCCSRSECMLVALLGVLRAGAGYVPLDPAFPADRLEFMATDAALRFVATDAGVPGPWKFRAAQALAVDALNAGLGLRAPAGDVNDVAYLIYTSGSTGRPKGVRVPHRSVTNLLASLRHTPGMNSGHRVLSVTTLSFDIAVSELLMPLTVGACIVVADGRQCTDGERLRALIETENVNFVDATPSTWRLLLAAGWPGRRDLLAICTGEPLPPDLGRELLPLVGELWNGYGPTETTVWSSFHRVTAVDGPVPIGRPVANTRFEVVDGQLRPLPVGAVGELIIGGEGVTLGYLDRPELSAEKFLADPLRAPGALRYRTGDLGRWRNDGVLECLGRIDHQVKVRGYRIELGDIESNLTLHEAVERALAVTREFGPGDTRIVAYVVPRGSAPDAAELRRHLGALLPEYMLPQHFVMIDAIPLLPNGKIDRGSLPKPELQRQGQPGRSAPPRGELESEVLAAMEAVLNLPGLDLDDDFFALGGHSLLAARLTAQLNRRFQLSLPMSTLFESPTAARLTQTVRSAQAAGAPQQELILHLPDRRSAPLTLMQERIRFMQELHPAQVLYNTPSAHRLQGSMDPGLFERALNLVVARQSSLRTWIARAADGRTHVQRIEAVIHVTLAVEDLADVPADEREAELLRRMQLIVDRPFDVSVAPLFKVALYRLAADEHVFLFMPHHIIWDGWSFDLLYTEIAAAYGALVAGHEPDLPALPVSYGDYADWHHRWMSGPEAARQLTFWRTRLQAAPALPALRARATGMSGEGAAEWIRLDKALTERLRAVAAAHGVTLNMLTLAAYATLVAHAWRSPVVAVGLPMRGRPMSEVDGVMGFFNNTLPIHVAVDSTQAIDAYLGGIRTRLLDIFKHQDIPFEALAADPVIAQQLRRTGLYQVMFSFQDARGRERDWGGLRQSSVLIVQKGATEDLGLWLMEVPGGLEGAFIYNAELFDAATVQAFRGCYLRLLERLALAVPNTVGQWCDSIDATELLLLQAPLRPAAAAPRGVAPATWAPGSDEDELRQIWSAALGIEPERIGAEHSLFDLGGTSLTAMAVVAAVASRLGVDLPAVALIETPTIPELARVLREPRAMHSRVQLRAGGDRPPIFLVHDADGATLLYRNLAHRFDPAHPVFGLQPLVDAGGLPVHTRIEEMAAHYVELMREIQPHGPYLVGGLCAGGVISFEIALQLRAAGEEVAMVALIDAADVVIYESNTSLAAQRLRRLQQAIIGTRDESLTQRIGSVTALLARKAQSYAAYKVTQRERSHRTSNGVETLRSSRDAGLAPPVKALEISLRDVYNDAASRYRQRAQLADGVVLVRARQGDGQQDDRPLVDLVDDATFGWQRHVRAPIQCIDVAGGHSSLLQEPHVGEVGHALQRFVDAALARSGTLPAR